MRDVRREYEIAGTLYFQWWERLLEGGTAPPANPRETTAEQADIAELKRNVCRLERAFGRKTYDLAIAGTVAVRLTLVDVEVPNGSDSSITSR